MISVIDLLNVLAARGVIAHHGGSKNFCDCCITRHFRYWYENQANGDSIYICTVKDLAAIRSPSGAWRFLTLMQLIDELL
jgi:hypothetical protein